MKDQPKASADDHESERQFDTLLLYLKRVRGIDLSGYKRPSLMRRITRRMEAVKIEGVERYIDYLEVHPEEFTQLFNYLLINVTAFFRDQPAWDYLNETILPKLIEAKPPDAEIRVWSAGCASGQEPYSIAMFLCERLGMEAFQKRVKVYASDMDPEALHEARQAVYTAKDVEAVPQPLIEKYFERTDNRYVVHADVRRAVIFGRHDLVADAPISRLDLLICRNTLMYFNAEMQDHILARFHFALNETGYLLLGKAEMLLTHANLFTPVELKHRIFAKSTNLGVRDRLRVLHHIGEEDAANRLTQQLRVRDLSFNIAPYPHLVVDLEGNVALANDQARAAFKLAPDDIGRPFRDLEISYRPMELRGPLEQAFTGRKLVRVPNTERPAPDPATQQFEVEIVPLMEDGRTIVGASLTFRDVSETVRLQGELRRSKEELETSYEELQSTNEELETTNEELQSTVEELETTNEELQSTNEELETMNEERKRLSRGDPGQPRIGRRRVGRGFDRRFMEPSNRGALGTSFRGGERQVICEFGHRPAGRRIGGPHSYGRQYRHASNRHRELRQSTRKTDCLPRDLLAPSRWRVNDSWCAALYGRRAEKGRCCDPGRFVTSAAHPPLPSHRGRS
jgi:two-component system, chemotaxis family, CheB/CheR fusion protein